MDNKSGAQISKKAFIQSLVILFALMMLAGLLTRVIPSGEYSTLTSNGRNMIDPNSYRLVDQPNYPVWRWLTAPVEVLSSENGLAIIVIIVVLFFAGSAFAVIEKTGTLKAFISMVVLRFQNSKYTLLWMVSLAFMLMGATLGTFEEVVLLIPVTLALSFSFGWDALVGLGMSILATNMGFSAALTNPFTLGVAQKLADLPPGSGRLFRGFFFISVYLVFMLFLNGYAHKIEKDPATSLLHGKDDAERERYSHIEDGTQLVTPSQKRAITFFGIMVALIVLSMLIVPMLPSIADFSLPIVGVLFLIGGLGAGFLSGAGSKMIAKGLTDGITGLLPSIPLILMAASIKFIIDNGKVTATILHAASTPFHQLGAFPASVVIYGLALGIEFFIASGTAKALLMMPIVLPLADMIGVTHQTTVLAYIFGDGFSNLAYPTNPVLLISLGLTGVSYPQWLRWTAKLWIAVLALTISALAIASYIHLGPF